MATAARRGLTPAKSRTALSPPMDGVLLHFVHPGNPFSPDPDGVVSVQRNFIAAAPGGFHFRYWGVGRPGVASLTDSDRWTFQAVVMSTTQRPLVPLSLRFAARLLPERHGFRAGVLRFDRVESALPFLRSPLPKVLFLHTWNSQDIRNRASESRWRRLAPVHDRLSRAVLARMDLIYVLRPDMQAVVAGQVPHGATRVRPFEVPVDLQRFRPLPPAERAVARRQLAVELGVPANAKLVLFAGRLERPKRPEAVPAVAAVLSGQGRPVHLLMAGTGSLAGAVRQAAQAVAPGRVHMLGAMSQDRLARLMAASDALLLPSAYEAFPNVVLEALACGTPIVATVAAGRTKEILARGHVGALAGSTPQDLAAALTETLAAGDAWRRACREVAEGFGSASLNAPIYEDLQSLSAAG